ncbi:hypothetical protein RJ640_006610 [Escallonia rubra]|uniref:Uncharacterized protein n=1 Tax=Escallonia rubra TaxID=112253 RepID=A0AA88RKZ7_9ASTE|nr:hypothetical protein RJ640_006610 [Escallonia rubra]
MASATLDPTPLHLDSIPTVDLRLLSQSELHALSLCSSSSAAAFDPRRCDDVVIPKIDRSVFNESAGSRKQTFSRLRLAPAASSASLRLVPVVTPENIFEYTDLQPQSSLLSEVASNGRKRKRGRPRKDGRVMYYDEDDDVAKDVIVNVDDREREMVNKNGIVVDMAVLAGLEDPFGPELKRRTEGLVTKEALLEFLGGLDGEWNSKRRKKKAVDASQFGDALPKGWKVSLTIKKREDRVWLICRRYIRFLPNFIGSHCAFYVDLFYSL